MNPDIAEQRILICAPLGRDAELTASVLETAGLSCCICKDVAEVVRELRQGAGAILAVEEALPPSLSSSLTEYIYAQPPWSDLPILVLVKPGGNSPWIDGAYERLGNLTLLERPVRSSTLVSAVWSTLRARLRQYEVRKADQRKDEFLAMLGHELRNPLAPIGAAAELLAMAPSDPQKVRQSSEIIIRQVRHMTSLIDDLLDVARVTRGLVALDREAVDMRHILSEAVEQVSPFICTRRHQLNLQLSPDPATVRGDRKRLIQVVANVLSNAAKYTPENGIITASLHTEENEVRLEVADNGIGMGPETVARVFDLFAQAERSADRSQGGLGLGLSLVKSLVESHGGRAHAMSEGLGKGSRFIIHLPHLQGDPCAEPAAAISARTALSAACAFPVLVVDDNADAANSLQMLLDAAGYEVAVRYTADSAIEHARTAAPRVCLLDIGLPDMDGFALAQRLRTMPETSKAVLIAVTGYGQAQDRAKSIAAGFDHHFVKPVDTGGLLALLAALN